jgi:uncharacterized membrane protein YedE/YeeE
MSSHVKINKTQPIIAFVILAAVVLYSNMLSGVNSKLSLFLITGLCLGYILTRSRFGFAGGIKRIYVTGESSLTRALLIMFAVTMVAMTGIHWIAAVKGALPSFIAAKGDPVIPGTSSVSFLNISTILGGFLFGIGMMLAGGCASGTLSDLGEGNVRSLIALVTFVFGSIPGVLAKDVLDKSSIGKIGAKVYLPEVFGYVGALVASLALLLIIYVIARKYEDFRKKEGYHNELVYEPEEMPLPDEGNFKLFSYRTYHKFFVERWSFLAGGLMLSVIFVLIINTTGISWGVTAPLGVWGVSVLQLFGIEFTSPALASTVNAAAAGILNDTGSLRNIGIIVGALIAFLLMGRFKLDFDFNAKDTAYYLLGGLLMGFGARLAGGCNIGALFSGICNFSLSGWGFMVALTFGGITALKLFAGKVNILPPSRYTRQPVKTTISQMSQN